VAEPRNVPNQSPGLDGDGRTVGTLRHPSPLLESLVSEHLDPGYQAAADRRSTHHAPLPAPTRWRLRSYLLAGSVVLGTVLGIAAGSTHNEAAGTAKARLALRNDIDDAQAQQNRLAATERSLLAEIHAAQTSLGAGGPLQTVRMLESMGGLTAARGPGLTVVIDGSTASSGAGVILDRDVQLLVNGLWAAGAEGIAIGGVRLRTTSAIRQAGGAILVDNRPVFWPLTVEAIGNTATLHVNFVDTVGFGRFQSFVSLYGVRFDVSAQSSLTLPAGIPVNLQYAKAITGTVTSSLRDATPPAFPAPDRPTENPSAPPTS